MSTMGSETGRRTRLRRNSARKQRSRGRTPPTTGPASRYRVQREDALDFLAPEYTDLFDHSEATAFQHGAWLHRLYSSLAPRRGSLPCVVTVRDTVGDRLIAVLPLIRRRLGPLRLVEYADLGVCDYAAAVVRTEHQEGVRADATLAPRIRRVLPAYDLLLVQRVPDSPENVTSLIAGGRSNRHPYGAHLIELAGTVDGWRIALDPSFRRHLDRKYKRLRPKGGSRLRVVTDPTEVPAVMAALREFRRVRFAERGGTDLTQDPGYFDFYQDVARDGVLGRGPARLTVLDVGNEPAAVALNLAEPRGEVYVLVGYDLHRLRNYSLGLLIVDQLARAVIERGEEYLDLTVGDEPYKSDFGARRRQLFEVYAARTPAGLALYSGRLAYLASRRTAKRTVVAWKSNWPKIRARFAPGTVAKK